MPSTKAIFYLAKSSFLSVCRRRCADVCSCRWKKTNGRRCSSKDILRGLFPLDSSSGIAFMVLRAGFKKSEKEMELGIIPG
jgi:hypothetical protein